MRSDLPNVRKIFRAEEGYVFLEADFKGADAQIVAAEAKDYEFLKTLQIPSIDIHKMNAIDIYGEDNYSPTKRQNAKNGVHAVNYGVQENTLSDTLQSSVYEARKFIENWFKKHPKIRLWQIETERCLKKHHEVKNIWGFRRFYFDYLELPKALAWIGQSSIGITTNKALLQCSKQLENVDLLLQVHDSLLFYLKKKDLKKTIPLLRKAMKVEIPYDSPLIIPVEISFGTALHEMKKCPEED